MKFYVDGDLTRNEFIKVGKFFRNMFKDTTKVINIVITEGLEHTSKEDTAKLMSEIFKGSKDYTIITIEKILPESFIHKNGSSSVEKKLGVY